MQEMVIDDLLTSSEAARLLGISNRTLGQWRKDRLIPFYKSSAKTVRYKKSELLSYIERFRHKTAEEERKEADELLRKMDARRAGGVRC